MPQTRPPAMFIADALGIDFLNSLATPVDTPVEWLASGADLIEWLEQAKLVATDVLGTVRRSSIPGELDAVAGQARALREWFREFVRQHKGKPLKTDALQELAPLNRILERDEEFVQIVKRDRVLDEPGHGALAWRSLRRWRSADSLLLPIARAIGDLVCNEDFVQVKACEGATCTLLFLDRTHGRARRWCSMAACGNRAKQAAHRARRGSR
jgi:predicted RNA-binding Zn ribbon-like protein